MDEAVRFAREIIRKRLALYNTESKSLKRDYEKSIQRDMEDLLFYARHHKLEMNAVWRRALAEE